MKDLKAGSDSGQDNAILAQFPEGYKGYAVELGALDGRYLSNTLKLEDQGWTVLCIEPNETHHEALKKNRKLVMTCACADRPGRELLSCNDGVPYKTQSSITPQDSGWRVQGEVEVKTLDQCLTEAGFPRVDAVSIDVDGIEHQILMGLNLGKWKPKIIIVEENASRCPIEDLLSSHGYERRNQMNHDWVYIRKDA